MPKTNFGKWSVVLIIAMFILIIIGFSLSDTMYESVPAGGTILEDIVQRPALAISMLVGWGAGFFALVTGLISIIKHKERNLLVYLSTLIGAGLTVFLIANFLFPG